MLCWSIVIIMRITYVFPVGDSDRDAGPSPGAESRLPARPPPDISLLGIQNNKFFTQHQHEKLQYSIGTGTQCCGAGAG